MYSAIIPSAAPDEHQKKLLDDAALLGEYLAEANVQDKRIATNYYRKDARG